MKILFTADLHSNKDAFKQFASILENKDFSLGIIAGDLTDGFISKEKILSMLDITEDDLLPELHSPDVSKEYAAQKEWGRQF